MENSEQGSPPGGTPPVLGLGSTGGEERMLPGQPGTSAPLLTTSGATGPSRLLTDPRADAPITLYEEIPRWESLSHQAIYARVHAGPGGQGSADAEVTWDLVRSTVDSIDSDLSEGVRKANGYWEGQAADRMSSAMLPMSGWVLDNTGRTSSLIAAMRLQADQAANLRNTMPEPPYGDVSPTDLWTQPGGWATSWSSVEQAQASAKSTAVDLMNSYTRNSAGNEQGSDWAPPPPPTTGNGGSGGGSGAGAGGVGAPPSAGAGGLGAVPSPDAAGAGVPGGGAGDDGAGGGIGSVPPVPAATSAANFSPPGPTSVPVHVPAVPSVAAVPSVPQSPHLLPGPIFAGSVVPPAPTTRRSGTVWSPEGAPVPPGMGTGGRRGAGGAAGGEPPRGGRGATAEPWGAARERIPGGSARGPGGGGPDMMPPTTGGAGAGSGGDRTRRRPSYLVEDADVFADDRWFPPRVIGAQQQGDDRG